MQAAFVDLGLERDAFLYVSDAVVDDDTANDGRPESEVRAMAVDGVAGEEVDNGVGRRT